MEQELISKVWQIHSMFGGVTPGLLTLVDGKVLFITPDGEQFNASVKEIKDIKWPFLLFGMGFTATIDGKKYKLSFSKPNPSAPELNDSNFQQVVRFFPLGRFVDGFSTIANISNDKKTGKQWKAVLGS